MSTDTHTHTQLHKHWRLKIWLIFWNLSPVVSKFCTSVEISTLSVKSRSHLSKGTSSSVIDFDSTCFLSFVRFFCQWCYTGKPFSSLAYKSLQQCRLSDSIQTARKIYFSFFLSHKIVHFISNMSLSYINSNWSTLLFTSFTHWCQKLPCAVPSCLYIHTHSLYCCDLQRRHECSNTQCFS